MALQSSALGALPPELLLRITETLGREGLVSLSSANSHFRTFLAPVIFQTITISSEHGREEDLSQLCDNFGKHVEELSFECHLHPNLEEEEENNEAENSATPDPNAASPGQLSQQLQDILSGRTLPNLRSLRITFLPEKNFNHEDGWEEEGYGGGTIYVHQTPESSYEAVFFGKEKAYSWRAMLNQVFKSMAANASIRSLDLVDLLPKPCSIFWSEEWAAFLRHLENVRIELWGGDNGAGWHSNTLEGYLHSVAELSGFIFDHLTSVKKLEVVADDGNPVGCAGMNHVPFPVLPGAMDETLESLVLENFFIDPPLLEFLQAKSQQLKTLQLINCFAGLEGLSENGIPWAELFVGIRESKPALHMLVVFNTSVALTQDEEFGRVESVEELPEAVIAVREALKADARRKLFDYRTLDDKYGMVFVDEDLNIERFQQGEDQREYDALMEVVSNNRADIGLPADYPVPTSEVQSRNDRQRERRGDD